MFVFAAINFMSFIFCQSISLFFIVTKTRESLPEEIFQQVLGWQKHTHVTYVVYRFFNKECFYFMISSTLKPPFYGLGISVAKTNYALSFTWISKLFNRSSSINCFINTLGYPFFQSEIHHPCIVLEEIKIHQI